MAQPRFSTFKNQVKIRPGQSLGFQTGKGYYPRGGTPLARPTPPVDPFAPLTDAQLNAQATGSVMPGVNAALDQLKKVYASRSADASRAITGYTTAFADRLGGYGDSAKQAYAEAEGQQAGVTPGPESSSPKWPEPHTRCMERATGLSASADRDSRTSRRPSKTGSVRGAADV